MAPLDHPSASAAASSTSEAGAWVTPDDEKAQFSRLEWTVIALARRDRMSSIRQPGPIARAARSLFGSGSRSSLADRRLEALRRIAVHAWYMSHRLPVSEVKRFLAAGFSIGQFEALLASISSNRSFQRRSA